MGVGVGVAPRIPCAARDTNTNRHNRCVLHLLALSLLSLLFSSLLFFLFFVCLFSQSLWAPRSPPLLASRVSLPLPVDPSIGRFSLLFSSLLILLETKRHFPLFLFCFLFSSLSPTCRVTDGTDKREKKKRGKTSLRRPGIQLDDDDFGK